jgi:phage gp29-like protein
MAKSSGGAPRERAPKRQSQLTEVLVGPVPLSEQFARIGGNLTPARVSAILQMADMGRPWGLVDLFHELRQKSGHLQSIMQAREICVASVPFDIAPPGEKPKKRDKKRARQCKLALQKCETLANAIAHWVGEGNAFGHATCEVLWKQETEGELSGLLVPESFERISCRRYGFRQIDGALLFDPTGTGSVDATGIDQLSEFPAGKYIQYRPRVNGDVLVREGLCRLLVWMALFENFDIRDWLQLAEIAWKPKRTAKILKGTISSTDKASALQILERLSTSGVAVYPDSMELMLHWPANFSQQQNHKELAEFLARQMSKAVLGTSDISEQNGKNGARAAVSTRNELRKELRDWDCCGVAKLLTKNLVKPFYQLNYGTTAEAGIYVPMIEDPADVQGFSAGMDSLRKAGLRIPASWVRTKIGAPEPKAGDEVLGPMQPTIAGAKAPKEPDPNDPESDDDAKPQDDSGAEEDDAA